MLAYAIDYQAPCTVILISGDRDFAYAVSVLRLRGYQVILISPTLPSAHASLKAQATLCLDWNIDIMSKLKSEPLPATPTRSSSIDGSQTCSCRAFRSGSTSVSSLSTSSSTTPRAAPHILQAGVGVSSDLKHVDADASMPDSNGHEFNVPPVDPLIRASPSKVLDTRDASVQVGADLSAYAVPDVTPAPTYTEKPTTSSSGFGPSPSPTEPFLDHVLPTAASRSLFSDPVSQDTKAVREVRSVPLTPGHLLHSSSHSKLNWQPAFPPSGPVPYPSIAPGYVSLPLIRPQAHPMPIISSTALSSTPAGHPLNLLSPPAHMSDRVHIGPRSAAPKHSATAVAPEATSQPLSGGVQMGIKPLDHGGGSPHPPAPPPRVPSTPSKVVPPKFVPLARCLEKYRSNGNLKPLRGQVAVDLTTQTKGVYKLAGISSFKAYTTLALGEGIISLGGKEGDAWISLHPDWHGKVP